MDLEYENASKKRLLAAFEYVDKLTCECNLAKKANSTLFENKNRAKFRCIDSF